MSLIGWQAMGLFDRLQQENRDREERGSPLLIPEDLNFWGEMGVFTAEDFDRFLEKDFQESTKKEKLKNLFD